MGTTSKKRREPARWQFLYRDANGRLTDDGREYKERCYAGSLKRACDRMLAWIKARAFSVVLDYEVRDNHHTDRKTHDCKDLNTLDHPITEYLN